jgi:hypothetical protein
MTPAIMRKTPNIRRRIFIFPPTITYEISVGKKLIALRTIIDRLSLQRS